MQRNEASRWSLAMISAKREGRGGRAIPSRRRWLVRPAIAAVMAVAMAASACAGSGNDSAPESVAAERSVEPPTATPSLPSTTVDGLVVQPPTTTLDTPPAGESSSSDAPSNEMVTDPESTGSNTAGSPEASVRPGTKASKPNATVAPGPSAPTTKPPVATPPPSAPATTPPSVPGQQSSGWLVTVYFTPRDSNYPGVITAINGCPIDYCEPGHQEPLGEYSQDFLERMRLQGTGFLTSGPFAGRYLNWSSGVGGSGYWIANVPKSASGEGLVLHQSAAAATKNLAFNDRFTIVDCGRMAFGGHINQSICSELKRPSWRVVDRFEPGAANRSNHLDLYLGVETEGQRFDESPYYLSWDDVVISVLR